MDYFIWGCIIFAGIVVMIKRDGFEINDSNGCLSIAIPGAVIAFLLYTCTH